MKKIFSIALSALMLTSCGEDLMDSINKDNGNPPADAVPANLQITEAIMSTGFSTTSGDYSFYLSSITEQEFGSGNNQFMKLELRNSNEIASSTTFNNCWNSTYSNLYNLKAIIEKTSSETGADAGQLDLRGMAQVLTALNYGILTDLHGDIPCSEALLGLDNLNPKLDAQEDVYKYIFSCLDGAISDLSAAVEGGMKNVGKQDILFNNDNQAWLASAYALKARYLLHTMYRNPAVLSDVIAACNKAIELGFNGMNLTGFNGVTCDNPWSAFIWSRGYVGSSATVANLYPAGDPRLELYAGYGEVYTPGDDEAASISWCESYPVWYDMGSQSIQLMSKDELYFILAEAQVRTGADASDAYKAAIDADFEDMAEFFGAFEVDGDYSSVDFGAATLSNIMVQKYLSQVRDEQIETYNDIRRCQALGESHITLTNPRNTQSGMNRWPYRLPYGNSSVISNPIIKEAFGDGSYVFSEKIWLYGGNR